MAKQGKKHRKHGTNKSRSISMANYRASGRMFSNKKRRIAKEARWQAACAEARRIHPERNDVCRVIRQHAIRY